MLGRKSGRAAALVLSTCLIGGARSCCEQLALAFPGEVVYPGVGPSSYNGVDTSALFQNLNIARFSNTAILSPRCIFRPSSADHVAEAMTILTSGDGCEFAIKSGGHMAVPGANNINDGVSMDLSLINGMALSDDRSTVLLGAGATWGAAYEHFEAEKVAFPGGVCGWTGVGGVSLGGGESYYQPTRGWVVDNVVNYEVVLASGERVDANQTSRPDLYRALKGGSSNFGVVTRVDVLAVHHEAMWGGQVIVPATEDNVRRTLEGVTAFVTENNVDVASGIQVVITYFSGGEAKVIDLAVGNVDGIEYPESLKNFTDMGPHLRDTVAMRSLSNWVKEVDTVQPPGARDLSATLTFMNDVETIKEIHEVTNRVYESVKSVPQMNWIFFYVPQPKIIQSHSAKLGGNVLGLAENATDEVVTFIVPKWEDPAYDEVMYAAAAEWYDGVRAVAERRGTYRPFQYVNFSWDFQRPLCDYGPDNVAFMREVAQKYDPNEVFQRLVPGGFKLSVCY